MISILAVVAAVVCVALGERSIHHDPYMATFLGHRSSRTIPEINNKFPIDVLDKIGSTFVIHSVNMTH